MKEYPETHQQGAVTIENEDEVKRLLYYKEHQTVDFGLQVARDGRVWVCINGLAFIRFRPEGMGLGTERSRVILKDASSIPPMHPRTEKVAV